MSPFPFVILAPGDLIDIPLCVYLLELFNVLLLVPCTYSLFIFSCTFLVLNYLYYSHVVFLLLYLLYCTVLGYLSGATCFRCSIINLLLLVLKWWVYSCDILTCIIILVVQEYYLEPKSLFVGYLKYFFVFSHMSFSFLYKSLSSVRRNAMVITREEMNLFQSSSRILATLLCGKWCVLLLLMFSPISMSTTLSSRFINSQWACLWCKIC